MVQCNTVLKVYMLLRSLYRIHKTYAVYVIAPLENQSRIRLFHGRSIRTLKDVCLLEVRPITLKS